MEIKEYCDANGVSYKETSKGLRVMDTTLLPGAMRDLCDEQGYVISSKPVPEAEVPAPAAEASEAESEGETSDEDAKPAKKGAKK